MAGLASTWLHSLGRPDSLPRPLIQCAICTPAVAAAAGLTAGRDALSCLLRIEGRTAATGDDTGSHLRYAGHAVWQSATAGAVITAIIALLTALVSALTLPGHFRFGTKSAAG